MKIKLIVLSMFFLLFSGCNVLEAYVPTFESPEVGYYYGDVYFRVYENGYLKFIKFSRDGYRYDNILVVAGTFHHQWGQNGGTHCPTDAYEIMGRFVSSTKVEGIIRYGYNCRFGKWQKFEAELDDPQESVGYDEFGNPI